MEINREELAWAAGFFDGEGHVGASVGRFRARTEWGRRRETVRRDVYLVVGQVERQVLDRFRRAVGCGAVSGPYIHPVMAKRGNEQPRYAFQTARFEHIQAIVVMLWTWLSPVKRAQAVAALTTMRMRSTHQRECRHGHPRTPENTYVSGRGRYRSCRTCKLDQMRHRRLVKKTAAALLVAS